MAIDEEDKKLATKSLPLKTEYLGTRRTKMTDSRLILAEIPNVLMCRVRMMSVSVEGRRPYCWSCGALRHMAEACPGKNARQVSAK